MVSLICEGTTVKKDYIIDPPKGLMKSAQSVCLSGLTSYLGMYKQLLQLMQGCFNKILLTGDGSAGACQEYVSKYTCDIVYKALSCASQGESFGTGARVEGGDYRIWEVYG